MVFRDDRRRNRAAQSIFDNLMILGCAEQYADRRLLVRFLHVAVESFEVKLQFAQIFWLKLVDFQFKCHEAIDRPIEEKQI